MPVSYATDSVGLNFLPEQEIKAPVKSQVGIL
jgi:hypothetical protein